MKFDTRRVSCGLTYIRAEIRETSFKLCIAISPNPRSTWMPFYLLSLTTGTGYRATVDRLPETSVTPGTVAALLNRSPIRISGRCRDVSTRQKRNGTNFQIYVRPTAVVHSDIAAMYETVCCGPTLCVRGKRPKFSCRPCTTCAAGYSCIYYNPESGRNTQRM